MTPLEGLRASLQRVADEAGAELGTVPPRVDVAPHEWPLSLEAARLLAASTFTLSEPPTREEWIAKGPTLGVLCPAGTTFDAAEALRLELVAKLPAGVVVDVQIAPSPPGELCAEDAAGARLFASERAERLNPAPSLDDPYPWETSLAPDPRFLSGALSEVEDAAKASPR